MRVYYFFLIPVKDPNIRNYTDPSLNSIRVNMSMLQTMRKKISNFDELQYVSLKGIDASRVSLDSIQLKSTLSERKWSSQKEILCAIINSFQFDSTSYEKCLSLSQYPLVVLKPDIKKLHVRYPASSEEVVSHFFLHLLQYLNVKQRHEERNTLETLVELSDSRYQTASPKCAKFFACCLNNLLINIRTRQITILRHECHRNKCVRGRFDNNLYQVVNQFLGRP